MYKSFILLSLFQNRQMIRNVDLPSCKNCKHFMPSSYTSDFTSSFAKCNKFGDKNIINDEITYDYVELCRSDENKCGHEGKYFEKEKNIKLKILKHLIIKNSTYYIIAISFLLPIYLKFIFRQMN